MFAKIVNGDPKDVAMFHCTSHGMSLLALNLGDKLVEGDKIVMVRGQQPSLCIPLLEMCRKHGTEIILVDNPEELLTVNMDGVKLVASSYCMRSDGVMTKLTEVRKRCDEVGAYLIVDATNSIGAIEFDVEQIKPHAVVASAHQWLGGLHGTALMWLHPEFHKGLIPLVHNDGNRENAGFGLGEDGYNIELMEGAARLDAGGRPDPVLLPQLYASIQQVLKWGIKNIEKHSFRLTQQIATRAKKIGMNVPDGHSPHIIGVCYPGQDGRGKTELLQKYLTKRKIYTSLCLGVIRISVWVYNTDKDVEGFFAAVNEFEYLPDAADEERVRLL